MTRVLITGANGFLGSRVVAQCERSAFTIRASGRSLPELTTKNEWRVADLRFEEQVTPLFDNVQLVIHAAGLAHQFGQRRSDKNAFYDNNVLATSNVVEAAASAGADHLVLVSSVSVYGGGSSLVGDHESCYPRDPYAISKYQAELTASRIASAAGLPLTILRFATMYGENDPGNVGRLMRAIDRGRFIWIGRGTNLKSLIHVNDAARACVRALAKPPRRGDVDIYNVSAPPSRMCEIVERLEAALEKKTPSFHIPALMPLAALWTLSRLTLGRGLPGRWHDAVRKWLRNDAYDGSRFARNFDFEATVPLAAGIAHEVACYRRAA